MKKTGLLGLAALAALNVAGNAHALTLTNKVGATAGPIDIASELDYSKSAVVGNVDVTIAPSTAANFLAGNTLLTITLTNATFQEAIDDADFAGCGGAAAISFTTTKGGAKGDSTVTLLGQGLETCTTVDPLVASAISVSPTGAGDVKASVSLTTEALTPLDGGSKTTTIATLKDAFAIDVVAAKNSTAIVAATKGAYLAFTGDLLGASLGTVDLLADTSVYSAFDGATKVSAADIVNADVTVTGDMGAFIGKGGSVKLDGTAFATVTATDASSTGVQATVVNSGGVAVDVTADGVAAIEASTYAVEVAYELAPQYATAAAESAALASIVRDGTSQVLPWTASATTAAGSGSTTFVRISNPTSDAFGNVSVRVLSSTKAASVGDSAVLATTVAAGGELLVNSQDIETALGQDFGRADLEISVEGTGAYVTRLVQRPDGVYEINNR